VIDARRVRKIGRWAAGLGHMATKAAMEDPLENSAIPYDESRSRCGACVRRDAKNERSQDPNVHSFDFRISRPDVGNILFIGYSGPRRLPPH